MKKFTLAVAILFVVFSYNMLADDDINGKLISIADKLSSNPVYEVMVGDGIDSTSKTWLGGNDDEQAWSLSALAKNGKLRLTGANPFISASFLHMYGHAHSHGHSKSAAWNAKTKIFMMKGQYQGSRLTHTVTSSLSSQNSFAVLAQAGPKSLAIEVVPCPDFDTTQNWMQYLERDALDIIDKIIKCYYTEDPTTNQWIERTDGGDPQTHLKMINAWNQKYGDEFVSKVELYQIGVGLLVQKVNTSSTTTSNSSQEGGGGSTSFPFFGASASGNKTTTDQTGDTISKGDSAQFVIGLPGANNACLESVTGDISEASGNFSPALASVDMPSVSIPSDQMPSIPDAADPEGGGGKEPNKYPGLNMDYDGIKNKNANNVASKSTANAENTQASLTQGVDVITNSQSMTNLANPKYKSPMPEIKEAAEDAEDDIVDVLL